MTHALPLSGRGRAGQPGGGGGALDRRPGGGGVLQLRAGKPLWLLAGEEQAGMLEPDSRSERGPLPAGVAENVGRAALGNEREKKSPACWVGARLPLAPPPVSRPQR